MVSQILTVYFQTYQLAYDLAKRTEKSFRYDLGLDESNFIQFGYWDSRKKGLLAGEKLHHDLKCAEMAYLSQSKREYELTKSISLAMLDPMALIQLRETGECFFSFPEVLFDLDHPGHYMRRIKAISVTIPCVAGPYASVSGTLTLQSNRIRKKTSTDPQYAWSGDFNDNRFNYNLGGIQSIATSSSQNDSGLFELNFRDERYLPFEGAGVISSWRLEMPDKFRQFDYDTITDVIIHIRYTAREGGATFKQHVEEQVEGALNAMLLEEGRRGLFRLFSARHEFPNEWLRFLHPAGDEHVQHMMVNLRPERFPYLFHDKSIQINQLVLLMKLRSIPEAYVAAPLTVSIMPPGATEGVSQSLEILGAQVMGGLPHAAWEYERTPESLGEWRLTVSEEHIGTLPAPLQTTEEVEGTVHHRLNPEAFEDLVFLCHYTIED